MPKTRFGDTGGKCPLPQEKQSARMPGCFIFDRTVQPFAPHKSDKAIPAPPSPPKFSSSVQALKPKIPDTAKPENVPPPPPANGNYNDKFKAQLEMHNDHEDALYHSVHKWPRTPLGLRPVLRVKPIYDKTTISELSPELREKAALIDEAYEARAYFDREMQEDYEQASHWDPNPEEILKNADTIRMNKNKAMYESSETLKRKFGGKYAIDIANSTPDIMVVRNMETGKISMVMHGANSGDTETITGREINQLDQASWMKSFTNPKNQTANRYPELNAVTENLINTYGRENISTVVYSNSGPKGVYVNKKYEVPTIGFDPVIGTAQSGDIRAGLPAEIHLVRTPLHSAGMDTGKFTNPARLVSDPIGPGNTSKNLKITTVSPLEHTADNPKPTDLFDRVLEGHAMDQFSAPESTPRQIEPGTHSKLNTFKTGAHGAAGGLAGLGIGMGVGHALGAAGISNPYVVAPVSGAVAGGAVHVGAQAIEKGLTKAALKGGLRAAGEGGALALAATPIDIGIANVLHKHGLNHESSQAVSGATANLVVSTPLLLLGPEAFIPAAAFVGLWTALSGGIGAFFGHQEDMQEEKQEETQTVHKQFFAGLEKYHYDIDKLFEQNRGNEGEYFKTELGEEYIDSVRHTLNLQAAFSNALNNSQYHVDKALQGDDKYYYDGELYDFNQLNADYIESVRNGIERQHAFQDALKNDQYDVDKALEGDEYYYDGELYDFKDLNSDYVAGVRQQIEENKPKPDTLEQYEKDHPNYEVKETNHGDEIQARGGMAS